MNLKSLVIATFNKFVLFVATGVKPSILRLVNTSILSRSKCVENCLFKISLSKKKKKKRVYVHTPNYYYDVISHCKLQINTFDVRGR